MGVANNYTLIFVIDPRPGSRRIMKAKEDGTFQGYQKLGFEVLRLAVEEFWKECDKIDKRKIKDYSRVSTHKGRPAKSVKNFDIIYEELYSINDVWFLVTEVNKEWFYDKIENELYKRYGEEIKKW